MVRKLTLALVMLSAAACGGDPELASSDHDIVDGEQAGGYEFAALVDAKLDVGVGECSGAVIAPRVVLTAGHCIHGFGPWRVTAPYADGQVAMGQTGVTFDWTADHDSPRSDQHDVGVVILDTPIQLSAYPSLAADGSAEGRDVRYVGRVRNGEASTSGLYVGDALTTRDGAQVGWPYTFATTKYAEEGDSGGPVVLAGDDHLIVGVDSGGNADLDIELLARVDLVRDWISEQVAAQGD